MTTKEYLAELLKQKIESEYRKEVNGSIDLDRPLHEINVGNLFAWWYAKNQLLEKLDNYSDENLPSIEDLTDALNNDDYLAEKALEVQTWLIDQNDWGNMVDLSICDED